MEDQNWTRLTLQHKVRVAAAAGCWVCSSTRARGKAMQGNRDSLGPKLTATPHLCRWHLAAAAAGLLPGKTEQCQSTGSQAVGGLSARRHLPEAAGKVRQGENRL